VRRVAALAHVIDTPLPTPTPATGSSSTRREETRRKLGLRVRSRLAPTTRRVARSASTRITLGSNTGARIRGGSVRR